MFDDGIKTAEELFTKYDEVSEKIITKGNTDIELGTMSLTGSDLNYKLSDETGQMDDASFNFKAADKEEKSVTRNGVVNVRFTKTMNFLKYNDIINSTEF